MHSHPQGAHFKGLGMSTGHFSESVLTPCHTHGEGGKGPETENRGTSPTLSQPLSQIRTGPRLLVMASPHFSVVAGLLPLNSQTLPIRQPTPFNDRRKDAT